MGKHLRLSFLRTNSSSNSKKTDSNSPQIEVNNQHNASYASEEELYARVNKFLSSYKVPESEFDSSSGSHTSIDSLGSSGKQKLKAKKILRDEGNKHIAELIAHLHSDRPIVKTKFNVDDQDLELLESRESAVDLDKYFEEKKSKVKDKLWRTPYLFTKKNNKKISDSSPNGLHSVNRFGEGVKDGCDINLSLASKGRIFGDVFHKESEWNDIIEEADQVLQQFESNKRNLRARRGSLLQPRIIFLSPHPEVDCQRVLQSANCLPLRSWTSELFLDSKESAELMDSESKRNLKWNASVEDFRHLLSPELSHFGNDIYSMMVQAKRRMSLYPPVQVTKAIPFRRKSFNEGEVWAPNEPKKHQMRDYNEKLGLIRHNSGKQLEDKSDKSDTKIKTSNSFLTVPKEVVHSKHNKLNDIDQTSEQISIEKLSPQVMANELTLIVQDLLLAIKSTEMIILLIRPHSISPESCPNTTALLGLQKRVIQLIAYYILNDSDVQTSASRMAYFIEMAKELKTLRNWHSVYSVIMSLQSPPIARLRQSWQILGDQYSDQYCDFIEMSEIIKSESRCLDYTSPSVPIFNDLIDDLKERCGSKFYEIVKHRSRSNWTKRETLAVWVDQEIDDLISEANGKKSIQKRVQKIRKNSNDSTNKGFFGRLLSRSKSKDMSGSETSSVSDWTASRLSSLDSEFKFKPKQVSANSPMPSCKNIWSVTDFNKLREHDEKQILEEIARGLVHYQRNVTFYTLDDSDQSARNFLLFQEYQGLESCMKKSYALEPPKKSNKGIPKVVINKEEI